MEFTCINCEETFDIDEDDVLCGKCRWDGSVNADLAKLVAQIADLERTNAELKEVVVELLKHINHTPNCAWMATSDIGRCDCGCSDVRSRAQKLREEG